MSTDKKYKAEFVDQSWEQMSSLLDKEMPVKKKRRIGFIHFLGMIALIVIAFIVYTLLPPSATVTSIASQDNLKLSEGTNSKIKSNETKLTQSIIEKESVLEKEIIPQNSSKNLSDRDQKNSTPEFITNTTSNKDIVQDLAKPIPSLQNKKNRIRNSVNNTLDKNISTTNPQLMANLLPSATIKTNTIPTAKIASSNIIKTPTEKDKEIKPALWSSVAVLPQIKLMPLNYTEDKRLDTKLLNRITPTLCGPGVNRWDFKLSAAVASNLNWRDRGLGIISRVNYYPLSSSPSWSLEGGVGIFAHQLNTNETEAIDILADDMSDSEVANFNAQIDQLSAFINSATRQYQVVSNLGISKTLWNRLSLSAGAKYKYTLSRNATELMLPDNIGLIEPEKLFTENEVFRNHFINPYLAIGYNITSRFSFRVESDISSLTYSLQSVDTKFSKKTSFLQAEMAYRF